MKINLVEKKKDVNKPVLTWPKLPVGQWFVYKFRSKNNGHYFNRYEHIMRRTVNGYVTMGCEEEITGITNTGLEVIPVEIKEITLEWTRENVEN